MRLALVYNSNDHKLQDASYSHCYRSMFYAIQDRFDDIQHVCCDRNAKDIDADLILFFDPHSSHHIKIEGIVKHSAIKMEYFNDPHQREIQGRYQDGTEVHKLDAKQRCERALERGIDYIISPYKQGYHDYIAPHLGSDADDMLLWFPIAPDVDQYTSGDKPLVDRTPDILASGATNDGGYGCYGLRNKLYQRDNIKVEPHFLRDSGIPKGGDFGGWLSRYAGALALMDFYPVPKYFEIPLAGCVCFAQYHDEYKELGFVDMVNCVYVTEHNFSDRIADFTNHIADYQEIATAGRKLVSDNYTSAHFADFIHDTAASLL